MTSNTSSLEELLNEVQILRQQNAELQGLHAQYRRTQQALSESEERFQMIADASPIMIWMAGPDRAGEYFNCAWLDFTGSTLDQEIEQGWSSHIHPDDIEIWADTYQAAYRDQHGFCIEYRLRRRDGQYCWMLDTASPRFLGEKQLIGFVGSCLDISERKAAEAGLQESQELYRALFETMAHGVIYWDADGNMRSANPAAEHIIGQSRDDLSAWHLQNTQYPTLAEDGKPLAPDQVPSRVTLQTGQAIKDFVMGVYNPQIRAYRWLKISTSPQLDSDNRLVGTYATFDDITSRKRSTDAMRFLFDASSQLASSLDYETTLKNIARTAVPELADWCAIDMREADGSLRRLAVEHVDPAKVRLAHELWERYPVDPNSATGSAQVLRSGQAELIHEITDDMLTASGTIDPEYLQIIRSLGLRSSMTVPLKARGHTLGIISFISAESGRLYNSDDLALAQELANHAGLAVDNARLYQEAQQAKTELESRVAERTAELEITVKELESFSYSVSHDLRAPLRTIDGFSRAILEDYADRLDDEGKNYLDRVRAATHTMAQLIDDLLKLSRVSRGEMRRETIDLSAMVESAAATLRTADPARTVKFEIAGGQMVTGDPRLLRIAVDNLVGNAWKFTSKRPDAKIEFGVTQHDGRPVYFVRDNGAGFDMTYANKLFGAFQRLHSENEFKGSGIGLATVQRIIRRHGGQIWAEGEVDQGATFYFTI